MTDFIHEHPKDEQSAVPAPAPAEEPPLDEKAGQKRVYGYIFILFVVAFSLLLWAFFMNQRSTDEVLSELRGNAGALQSTLERNVALEQQVDALEQQIQTLTEENEALQGRLHAQEIDAGQATLAREETDAARSVYYATVLANEERYREAAAELAERKTAELVESLDGYDAKAEHYAGENGQPESARSYYDALVERLAELGYLTVGEDGQLAVAEPAD